MDYTSLFLPGAIALYGAFEYHRRKDEHAILMSHLAAKKAFPERKRTVSSVGIFTTGVTAFIVGVFVAVLFLIPPPRYGSLRVIAAFVLPFFVVLILMVVRDTRRLREQRRLEAK